MPPAPLDPRTGLAFSGGGFRATLFHAGALIRLNELRMLRRIDRIASVSGGSITSGRLAAVWERLEWDREAPDGMALNLDALVIKPLRAFCRRPLDTSVIAGGLIPFTRSAPERLVDAYDEDLMEGMTIDQLPQAPDFVFMTTNLQTGKALRFEREKVADYTVGEIRDTSIFRVAQAVAASSAFPPVLSPLTIKLPEGVWSETVGAEFFGQREYMAELNLTDGGAYDNLGLERIDRFKTMLSSDAGKPLGHGPTFGMQSLKQVLRVLSIAMDQTRALRTRDAIARAADSGQVPCLWGLNQGPTDPKDVAPDILPRDPAIIAALTQIRTRLNPFDAQEQGRLINWGYATCDERMRSYVLKDAEPPQGFPVPEFPLG